MSAGVLFDAPGPKARMRYRILGVVGAVVFLGVLGLLVLRLNDKGQFRSELWTPFTEWDYWSSYLLSGLWGTLKAAVISILLAALLGFGFALARMSEIAPLRWIASVLVELFRAIPVLLMMLFTYGFLSTREDLVSSDNAPLVATVIGLVMYNSAVVCEVIRSGVEQLPKGQREAGLSIGLKPSQTLRTILLPQAVTTMLPALISQLVVIVKDTALGYNVLYGELLYSGKIGATGPANIVPMMFVVAAIYIAVNYSISKLAERVEARMKRRGTGGTTQQVPGGPIVEPKGA